MGELAIMKKFGVELLLIAMCVIMALTVTISYTLAVHNNHAEPYFPFISTTGDFPPESCIFTLGCSITAMLCIVIVCVRYKHVRFLYLESITNISCLNVLAAVTGIISAIGMLIVASFQERAVVVVHSIGAFTLFFGGVIYGWLQTLISYKIFKSQLSSHVGRCLLVFRFIICTIGTITCFGLVITDVIAHRHLDFEDHNLERIVYILSACLEWVTAALFLLYFLTFHWDFMKVSMDVRIKHRYHHSDILYQSIMDDRVPLTL